MLIQYESDHGNINGQKGKKYLPPYKCHRGHCGHDHMVVGFTTTYAAGQGFLRVLRFPPPIKLTAMI